MAFPNAIGKIPVAKGSSVPAWPILFKENNFFNFLTTSNELKLIGLFIQIQPLEKELLFDFVLLLTKLQKVFLS